MTVGMNIKAVRKSKKITQAELSELSGLCRSYICDLEGDRYNPSVDTLTKLAEALETDPASLMDGVIRENPNPAGSSGLSAFDRKEFRGLTHEEIEMLAGIAGMFKSSRKNAGEQKSGDLNTD
ncbi:MAG: helix-turn-helix domain-containing protein [Defluviitaleaceae bacterium]|nr:helix-turn-helix domain-containing protein [Defluviitaleaceae bacterium]